MFYEVMWISVTVPGDFVQFLSDPITIYLKLATTNAVVASYFDNTCFDSLIR